MDVLALIAKASEIIALAAQVGQDISSVLPLVTKIKGWATGTTKVTQADMDDLLATEKIYLDMLNDTSQDNEND